ncbi:glucokinase [Microlunatus sagamiharensis]|uniref:Glucokinase n=1 Tax=Microlunatus sagamiharensis TaxID=546874 RepID=A0A1H2MFZ0_9ACTN|nr:ROK family protein [Microlunatus sagamiharensis]SDU91955.1 glucokinase [Microlunatus sagamiharensis]
MPEAAPEVVLAVDVGGTKMALALVDDTGTVLAEELRPTPAEADPERVVAPLLDAVAALVRRLSAAEGPLRVGISSAGPLDAPAGTVSPVNIGAWRGFPLVERVHAAIAAETDRPVVVGLANDGHCFTLGEHWLGAGRDVASMVGMVLSTGVGAGAVLDDRLFGGTTGNAVHLGHISVNAWGARCVCGGHGCVEMYARGPAMVAAAQQRGWTGGTDARALTADARAGDPVALAVIDEGMRALAAGIATTATELDVTTFVLGGGVSKAGEVVLGPLRRHLPDFAVLPYVTDLEVRPAVLENAGLLGAAALALRLEA